MEKLIQRLQSEEGVDTTRLARVEWMYLPLLDTDQGQTPKTLEQELADDPGFFCELIRLMFKPRSQEHPGEDQPNATKKMLAERSHKLLSDWRTPPGNQKDGHFDPVACIDWYEKILASLRASDHEAVGMHMAGQALRHAPADPDGLWLHKDVAALLNREDMHELRRGFDLGIVNSRGCHFVAPDGSGEETLAKEWSDKANEIENAGFHRLAVTLRGIADGYRRDAERVRLEHKGDHA